MAKSNGCLLLLRVLFILLNFCVHIVRRVGFVRCRRLHLTLQFPLNIEYIQWFVRVFIYRHFGDAYFVLLMSCTAKTKMFSDQRCFRKRNTLHILCPLTHYRLCSSIAPFLIGKHWLWFYMRVGEAESVFALTYPTIRSRKPQRPIRCVYIRRTSSRLWELYVFCSSLSWAHEMVQRSASICMLSKHANTNTGCVFNGILALKILVGPYKQHIVVAPI